MSKHGKSREELLQEHTKLCSRIALQAVRVHEMKKILSRYSDELLILESEIERFDAEAKGSGFN